MMTQNERKARKMFRELLAHYGGDLHKLELALWAQVKRGGKLPTITPNKTGAPLKPYKGVS